MTLKEAKEYVKANGISDAIYLLADMDVDESGNLREVLYDFMDALPEKTYYKALRKATAPSEYDDEDDD